MMVSLRRALCDHLEATRVFALKTIGVDSGIYDAKHLSTVLRAPGAIVELETAWIEELLEALRIIQRYMGLVERWTTHVFGLERNLGIREADGLRIQRREVSAVDLLQSKELDKDYLRWMLSDAAEEVDRLTAANEELLAELPRLLELVQKFRGVYLEEVGQVAQAWVTGDRLNFPRQLIRTIEAAYAETSAKGILQQIGRYVDIMIAVVTAAPVLGGTATSTPYTSDLLASHHEEVDRLLRHTHELKEAVARRSQAWLLLVRHQQALLQAVLPSTTVVDEWLVKQYTDPSASIDDLLPSDIDAAALPLALEQAKELLTEWGAAIEAVVPHLRRALSLNDMLQSPVLAKFLTAGQERLNLYREWRPKLAATFDILYRGFAQN
jgi:hypothetical protein